jgi:hypothetical protein
VVPEGVVPPVLASCCRQRSRSAPSRPTQLLPAVPVAPVELDAAPVDGVVLVEGEVEVCAIDAPASAKSAAAVAVLTNLIIPVSPSRVGGYCS